jgi:hypothetical protein
LLRQLQTEAPLTPGSLYLLRRKCGKPACRCSQGELHEAWVLTRSENGKKKLYSVPDAERSSLRERAHAYRRYQRGRAAWIKQCDQLLAQIDAFAEAQVVQWPLPPAP